MLTFLCQTAQSELALFCSAFQVLERIAEAKVPICGLAWARRQAVKVCIAIWLFCVNRVVERVDIVAYVVVGGLAYLILYLPCGVGDETAAKRGIVLMGSHNQSLTASLEEVFKVSARNHIFLGDPQCVRHVVSTESTEVYLYPQTKVTKQLKWQVIWVRIGIRLLFIGFCCLLFFLSQTIFFRFFILASIMMIVWVIK